MIVLVRHGETRVNREQRLQGRSDAPLTRVGRGQAAAAGAALAGGAATRVLSSPLRRARETASAIGEACGLDVEVDERLVELDYGAWEGRALLEVDSADWARWRGDPAFAPPGGESLLDVERRVVGVMEELRAAAPVVVVTHVSPLKAAVGWALGTGVSVTWRLHVDVASVTRLEARGSAMVVRSFNETGHLRGAPLGDRTES